MADNDLVDAMRFVGGFAGLELRGAEPHASNFKQLFADPTANAIDRAPTELGIFSP